MKARADHQDSSSPYERSFILSFDSFDRGGTILLWGYHVCESIFKGKQISLKAVRF